MKSIPERQRRLGVASITTVNTTVIAKQSNLFAVRNIRVQQLVMAVQISGDVGEATKNYFVSQAKSAEGADLVGQSINTGKP